MSDKKKNSLQDLAFEEKYDYEKGFAKYFDSEVKKAITPVEEKRLELLEVIKKRKKIFFGVLIFLILLFALIMDPSLIMVFGFIMIGLGTWAFFMPRREYKKVAKNNILPVIAKFFGDFSYQIDGKISEDLDKFKIVPNYDIYNSEDYLKGKHKDVDIEMSEVELKQKRETTDSDGNRQTEYTTVFRGFFILLEMNKKFKGQTLIKTDMGSLFNWLGEKFGNLERVKLEDPVFEKMFEVYASDQIEARYILTTAFMQRIVDLAEVYGSKRIQASFLKDRVFMTIPFNKNLFEPQGIYKSAVDIEGTRKFLSHINYVFQIIDLLKMNNKIGM